MENIDGMLSNVLLKYSFDENCYNKVKSVQSLLESFKDVEVVVNDSYDLYTYLTDSYNLDALTTCAILYEYIRDNTSDTVIRDVCESSLGVWLDEYNKDILKNYAVDSRGMIQGMIGKALWKSKRCKCIPYRVLSGRVQYKHCGRIWQSTNTMYSPWQSINTVYSTDDNFEVYELHFPSGYSVVRLNNRYSRFFQVFVGGKPVMNKAVVTYEVNNIDVKTFLRKCMFRN